MAKYRCIEGLFILSLQTSPNSFDQSNSQNKLWIHDNNRWDCHVTGGWWTGGRQGQNCGVKEGQSLQAAYRGESTADSTVIVTASITHVRWAT